MRRPPPLWCLVMVIAVQCWVSAPERTHPYATARERLAAAPPACRVVAERLAVVGGEDLAERVGIVMALRSADLAAECERLAAMPDGEMVTELRERLGPL